MNNIELIKQFAQENDVPIMLDGGISFLMDFIKENNVKSILEIGSAIGFSSIMMASVTEDIYIDTIELDKKRYEIAIKNMDSFKLNNRISIYNIDAIDFKSNKKYDLIFIDGPKAQYKKHFDLFMKNINQNGYFIFDNINFHGMVDNPSLTNNRNTKALVRKIKNFRDEMINDDRYNVEYLKDVGDGVMIVKMK